MQERDDQLITGTLALGEVFAGAYKRGANRERIQAVKAALEDAVSEVIPFTVETADVFGQIKGSLNIPSADAIHLACAASAGTDLFLTNDKNLVGKVIPGIQFIAGLDSNIL
jgi:predicted nucleic acid-binding protein